MALLPKAATASGNITLRWNRKFVQVGWGMCHYSLTMKKLCFNFPKALK